MVVTSKALPRMGLGMAALGRPGYINLDHLCSVFGESQERTMETMQQQANRVMDALFAACDSPTGKPWLDCARSYGLAEKFVGEHLHANNVDPTDVYVSSKWGYTYVADWEVSLAEGAPHEVKDHSAENFLKHVKETDEHLGEYIFASAIVELSIVDQLDQYCQRLR